MFVLLPTIRKCQEPPVNSIPSKADDKTAKELATIEAEARRAIEILARRLDQAAAIKSNAGALLHPLAVN